MKKLQWIVSFLLIGNCIVAQEICEDSQILLGDLNSINKCFITLPSQKEQPQKEQPQKATQNRTLQLNNSIQKKRYLTVREKTPAYSLASSLKSIGIKEINTNIELESLITLRKDFTNEVHDFINVDRIPVFKTCTIHSDEHQHECFNHNMIKYINENIEYSDDVLDEGFSGEISVEFIIDSYGKTNNIQVTGGKKAPLLKGSVSNLVSKLPLFEPAKKNNRTVTVSYEFSLNFSL